VWSYLLEAHDPYEQSPSAILLPHRLVIAATDPEVRTHHTRHIPEREEREREVGVTGGHKKEGVRGGCV
jgi:hypothetical protein